MDHARLEARLVAIWYARSRPPLGLRLLEVLFRAVVAVRRAAYRRGILPSRRVGAPVVVIGNITVGGSGKTPFTIWLAGALRERGVAVGIVTRGYGARGRYWPRAVQAEDAAVTVGDEALLLARRTGCPVVAGPARAAAAAHLLDHHRVDVILSDDGLQHYALARDLEIAVVDGERGLGNGHALPAGPLREPARRLDEVGLVVAKGEPQDAVLGARRPAVMTLALATARSLAGAGEQPLTAFQGAPVHAVAGIAHPEQFFAALRACGLHIIPHPLPDHAALSLADLDFGDARPVLMTEKDAVKIPPTEAGRYWAVPAEVTLPPAAAQCIVSSVLALAGKRSGIIED